MTTTLTHPVAAPVAPAPSRSLTDRLRGDGPAWARPALIALLVGTAVLYLWDLGASGWANSFYSAAAQAGSVSWKAWFFGSSDASNFITVDKTPGALWVTGLSVRLFGLSSWSILVPQALEGVATVGLLYATVRRWFGPAAGLIAGLVLATTPVATLMFRFNNPDALLVLLLVVGAYAVVRALEDARTSWLVLAGASVGFGFLTKMLQSLLVVPAFALVYLCCAPTTVRRRIVQLLISGAAMIASAGWWVAIVELVPASARPFIGGSQTNSILELTLGYNGFGRLTGNETGSVGGGPGGGWGATGWTRMFTSDIGGQISWLLPAALLLLVAGVALAGPAGRTERSRAAFLLWGGWLLVTGLTFSFMAGIFHAYYTVALAPAIAALVGMGVVALWRAREHVVASVVLAAAVAVTTVWADVLLARSSTFQPWLRTAIVVVGLLAAAALVLLPRMTRRVGLAVVGTAIAAMLAGPTAYSLQTASTGHSGAIVSAGPAVAGAGFGGGGGRPGGTGGGFGGGTGGGFGRGGNAGFAGTNGGPGGGAGGGMGGLLNGSTPGAALTALLTADSGAYTWVAATVGSNNASGYQLATGAPVMSIGGFNGSDPTPTLAQFQSYVTAGQIHYFIGTGSLGGQSSGGADVGTQIASWVSQHYTAKTVDGVTVYDLSAQR